MPLTERCDCIKVTPILPNRAAPVKRVWHRHAKNRDPRPSSWAILLSPSMTLSQWITRSSIGRTVRRWKRASRIIREMRDRELRGLSPRMAMNGPREEE